MLEKASVWLDYNKSPGKRVQKVHCWQMTNYSYRKEKLMIENAGC